MTRLAGACRLANDYLGKGLSGGRLVGAPAGAWRVRRAKATWAAASS